MRITGKPKKRADGSSDTTREKRKARSPIQSQAGQLTLWPLMTRGAAQQGDEAGNPLNACVLRRTEKLADCVHCVQPDVGHRSANSSPWQPGYGRDSVMAWSRRGHGVAMAARP